jgi:hypothetical protein
MSLAAEDAPSKAGRTTRLTRTAKLVTQRTSLATARVKRLGGLTRPRDAFLPASSLGRRLTTASIELERTAWSLEAWAWSLEA